MQGIHTAAVSVQMKPRPSSGACEPPAWVQSCHHPTLLLGDPFRGWGWVGREGRTPTASGEFSLAPLPPFLGTPGPVQPAPPQAQGAVLRSGGSLGTEGCVCTFRGGEHHCEHRGPQLQRALWQRAAPGAGPGPRGHRDKAPAGAGQRVGEEENGMDLGANSTRGTVGEHPDTKGTGGQAGPSS